MQYALVVDIVPVEPLQCIVKAQSGRLLVIFPGQQKADCGANNNVLFQRT